MIIDVTRELNDEEYKKHLDLLERYHEKYDYIRVHEMNYSEDDEYYEEPDKEMLNLTTKEEDEYIEDLDARASICADEFRYQRHWYVEENMLNHDVLLWLSKENITDYFLIREVIYDRFWLCLKNLDDYILFKTDWKKEFNSYFLAKHGWFEQKMGPEEQLKWAQENLGDDFLYDYRMDIGYFRNGTEAALKLRWEE